LEVGRTELSDAVFESTQSSSETSTLEQSIDGTRKAIGYDSGNVRAWAFLGDVYRARASRDDAMADRLADGQMALAAYQTALKLNPLDDIIQGKIGLTYDILHRYPEAFFSFQKAVAAQPYNGQFWDALGNHFWQRGLLLQAEEAFLKGAACPHGGEGAAAAAQKIQAILDQRNVPPPAPDINPAIPQPPPPPPEQITIP
jgi:anaphase-promoting complex subunit 8